MNRMIWGALVAAAIPASALIGALWLSLHPAAHAAFCGVV